jgi:hypothetical protein
LSHRSELFFVASFVVHIKSEIVRRTTSFSKHQSKNSKRSKPNMPQTSHPQRKSSLGNTFSMSQLRIRVTEAYLFKSRSFSHGWRNKKKTFGKFSSSLLLFSINPVSRKFALLDLYSVQGLITSIWFTASGVMLFVILEL